MGVTDPYMRCSRCGETRRKEGGFPVNKKNTSGYRGICLVCEPAPPPPPEPPKSPYTDEQAQKMCKGKIKYNTQNQAIKGALKFIGIATVQRPYRCPICRGWHLTTKRKFHGKT